MNVIFSQALSQLRHEKGVSQRQAAQELGVSQALLSHYENGIREPGLTFVVRVCDYYEVSADYLLGRTVNRKSQTGAVGCGRQDPEVLMHAADALSEACVSLCKQEPELGLLFRRMAGQMTKSLKKGSE